MNNDKMKQLYPLKFETIYKEKIWGGQKIKTILGKDYGDLPNCGETWEISGVKSNISIVENGALKGTNLRELLDNYKDKLVGESVYKKFGNEFPLLVKFIDANDDLSIQVHPDDELAKTRHDSNGKTEMWYIFQADEGAKLITGFNRPLDKTSYLKYFEEGKLLDILNVEEVKSDEVYFLPAGRVHTIGKGLLLAEIQQTSDITYRIYDFDRPGLDGKMRELHVEKALDAIDYNFYDQYQTLYKDKVNDPVELVSCPYFTTNKLNFDKLVNRDYSKLDSFVIYVCMEGAFNLQADDFEMSVEKGDAILIPACIEHVKLDPIGSFKILESYVGVLDV